MSIVRIAIANDYEIVVAGIASMLERFSDRIEVVELDSNRQVASDVDVVLYDTFAQAQGSGIDLEHLLHGSGAKVAVFSWNLQPELVEEAVQRGCCGYLSKALTAEEIVKAIEGIHSGELVLETQLQVAEDDLEAGDWPGRAQGLTQRESEVLALITQGLTNQEIADRAYLSINSVKTYIRTAYRKIGVERRSQAVSWGLRNGFSPDFTRTINGD